MTAPWIDPTLTLVGTIGIGGSALGLIGLLLPSPARTAWRALPLGLGLLVGCFCVLAVLLGQPAVTWGPPVGLLGVGVALSFVRSPAARSACVWAGRGIRSPRCQAAALLVCCPALAAWGIPAGVEAEPFFPSTSPLMHAAPRVLEDVRPSPARTDLGGVVTVRTNAARQPFTAAFLAKQSAQLRAWGFSERVITLPDGDMDCNCHGWVFSGGRFWIPCEEVDAILQDNAYRQVEEPRVGDLVVYRDENGAVTHTGAVRATGDGSPLLVESKWGGTGRFIHPPAVHPYGDGPWSYHRSPRAGHLLCGLSDTPTFDPRSADRNANKPLGTTFPLGATSPSFPQ